MPRPGGFPVPEDDPQGAASLLRQIAGNCQAQQVHFVFRRAALPRDAVAVAGSVLMMPGSF